MTRFFWNLVARGDLRWFRCHSNLIWHPLLLLGEFHQCLVNIDAACPSLVEGRQECCIVHLSWSLLCSALKSQEFVKLGIVVMLPDRSIFLKGRCLHC